MSMEDLNLQLEESITELTGLLEVTEDPDQQFTLREQIRELSAQLDKAIVSSLDTSTPEFFDAMDSLKRLVKDARQAQADTGKLAQVISNSAKTIAKVEKLLRSFA